MSTTTAVVVNYNAARELERCLATLHDNGLGGRIVVVDNGSKDASRLVAEAAGVRWVETGANLGYGRAANLGAGVDPARGAEFLLVCNPDVELRAGSVAGLAGALDADPKLAVVGPRMLNPDGSVYPSARTFPDFVDALGHGLLGLVAPKNRFTRRYRMLDWDHSSAARVDWVSGACFLARRRAWDEVGGFDPAYFMYLEDVDLCWRMSAAGWSAGYEPRAEVLHVQGVSTNRHPYRMIVSHHRSLWRFARQSTTGPRRAGLPVVAVGLAGRVMVAAADHRVGRARRSGQRPALPESPPPPRGGATGISRRQPLP